jgi:osmotically-inducible protein OsmY
MSIPIAIAPMVEGRNRPITCPPQGMLIRNAALFGLSLLLASATAMACSNADLQAALSKDFAKYKQVSVVVDDCSATITGKVELFSDIATIHQKAVKRHGIVLVAMSVVVDAPPMADADLVLRLQQKLRRRARADATSPFAVTSNQGTVTVTGVVGTLMSHDEALRLVGSTHGVRDIVDQLRVDALPNVMNGEPASATQSASFPPDYVGPIVPRIRP